MSIQISQLADCVNIEISRSSEERKSENYIGCPRHRNMGSHWQRMNALPPSTCHSINFKFCDHKAYIQSDKPFHCPICLRPQNTLKLHETVFWKLLKALHVECNSNDYWYINFVRHFIQDMGIIPIPAGRSVFLPGVTICSRALDLIVNDANTNGNAEWSKLME